jgi:hypothetical protein
VITEHSRNAGQGNAALVAAAAGVNATNQFDKTYVPQCQDNGCYYGLRRPGDRDLALSMVRERVLNASSRSRARWQLRAFNLVVANLVLDGIAL